jgi:GNAT superfamily N-acetyltransferase
LIKFFAVESEWGPHAYKAHAEFTSTNTAVLPKTREQFLEIVADGFVWAATDEDDQVIGLAYSKYDSENHEWETGGLMVLGLARGKGIGAILMMLALGAALAAEDPLAEDPKPQIVAHVLKRNPLPRGIILDVMKYHHALELRFPPDKLEGLPVEEDGLVHGDEFHLTFPDTLTALADFCSNWNGKLRTDEEARIEMPENTALELWAEIFREMASRK